MPRRSQIAASIKSRDAQDPVPILVTGQRLGYFPKLDEVPQVVVEHVREALRLPADVVAEVDATRTAKRHREFVRTRLGMKYNAAKARILAEEAIRAAAQTKDNPQT
jgi:Domain of unknown function (DUF4158)